MERAIANLSLNTLIRECSKNPQDARKIYGFFDSINRERIHEVFSYKKFNDDFIDNVTCYNDGKYQIGVIRPCYEEFLCKLIILLNVKITKPLIDNDDLTKKL